LNHQVTALKVTFFGLKVTFFGLKVTFFGLKVTFFGQYPQVKVTTTIGVTLLVR